jgi:hypothetical protein
VGGESRTVPADLRAAHGPRGSSLAASASTFANRRSGSGQRRSTPMTSAVRSARSRASAGREARCLPARGAQGRDARGRRRREQERRSLLPVLLGSLPRPAPLSHLGEAARQPAIRIRRRGAARPADLQCGDAVARIREGRERGRTRTPSGVSASPSSETFAGMPRARSASATARQREFAKAGQPRRTRRGPEPVLAACRAPRGRAAAARAAPRLLRRPPWPRSPSPPPSPTRPS